MSLLIFLSLVNSVFEVTITCYKHFLEKNESSLLDFMKLQSYFISKAPIAV